MRSIVLTAGALALFASAAVAAAEGEMGFFITSAGPGDGADLGGLEGADRHCNELAAAAGSEREWRAYLSASASGDDDPVHARERIGEGPWHNANGVLVAGNVDELHSEDNRIDKQTALDEQGREVNGRGDTPNMHDILTGSTADGKAFDDGADHTCSNWTSSSPDGSAQVGHHDRTGGGPDPTSWNSAHGSRGCGQEDLQGTGGNGLFYCFAVD